MEEPAPASSAGSVTPQPDDVRRLAYLGALLAQAVADLALHLPDL